MPRAIGEKPSNGFVNLEEILQDADTFVPNTLPVDQKCRWINNVQRQNFREYSLPSVMFAFAVQQGQQFYQMPDSASEERISRLVVDGKVYPFLAADQEELPFFYTIVSGMLMIHPSPEKSCLASMVMKPRPADVSADNLDQSPEFPEDFQELLVFGLASRIAKAQQDVALANNFDADFRELAAKAQRLLKPKTKNSVRIVKGWC